MKKKKVLLGLSLSGLLVLTGAAIALGSGNLPSVAAAEQSIPIQPGSSDQLSISGQVAPDGSQSPNSSYGYGYGMMGSYGVNGYGMMGGYGTPNYAGNYGMMGGGMMGGGMMRGGMMSGYGMMNGGFTASSLGVSLPKDQVENSEQAITIAKAYVEKLYLGFKVDQILEYSNVYEVKLKDAKTEEKAFEFLISKSGLVYPQMGPKMMWNSKYSHMNWGNSTTATLTTEQVTEIAINYINKLGEGYTLGSVESAPGYYEFIVKKDNKDYLELNVSSYTGQVIFENWNGPIINSILVQ